MPTFDIKNLADGPTTEEGQGLLNSNGVSANSTVATNTNSNLNASQSSASQTNISTDQQTSDVKIYLNKDLYGPISLAGSPSDSSRNKTLDTESLYISSDLLCEGPIEGLVDPDGSTLNYLSFDSNVANASSSLAYGMYYNDTPIRDKKTNFLNFSAANFFVSYGQEIDNLNSTPSAVYSYNSRIYDLDIDPGITEFKLYQFDEALFTDSTLVPLQQKLINARNISRNFSHYVKNKYTTRATVNIKVDTCFYIGGDGSTFSNHARFVVCVTNLFTRTRVYYFFQGYFVVKGSPTLIPIEIEFGKKNDLKSNNPEYIINIYSVEKRLSASDEKTNNFAKEFYVDSVIEKVGYRFSYPYSVVCENKISSKHFSNVPVRSFDCKLLKIKVPENYDADVHEYIGDWNGYFSKTLKWTDNPAWIFYDLCLNSRYGLAKTYITENDLNKWEMLKISKFCDELVITNAATKYNADNFSYDNKLKIDEKNYNTITFTWSKSINELRDAYPENGILFLYDVVNESEENININYKKIILSASLDGTTARLKLCNDFGMRRFIESDSSGEFYKSLQVYISGNPAILNTEEKIKFYALSYINSSVTSEYPSSNTSIAQKFTKSKIFDSTLKIKSGKCVARQQDYYDFLEPRFSANIYINENVEGLKILSDLASVFRGVFYFRNGLLNLTTDVKKPVVYLFTNSNVKEGNFTYTSANLETSFSVVKVSYLDKTDNFKDKIINVEDSSLIKKYGLIEKEILGFGITSRYQAERIGKWFLATSKLESQTVSFSTGIEVTNIKIGDIVRVADDLKFSKLAFGRVVSLDFKNNYIYIDREVNPTVLGKKIKIFSIVDDEPLETTLSVFAVDNPNLRLQIFSKSFVSWNSVAKILSSEDGSIVRGDNTGSAGWTRKGYTKQNFVDNCQIFYKVTYPSTYLACGLSSVNNITIDQTDIDYAFYISGGALYAIEKGLYTTASPFNFNKTIDEKSVLKIVFDGTKIIYFLNDVNLREVTRSIGNSLYGVIACNTPYAEVNNLNFTTYPDIDYGRFSNLRADANFSIYYDDSSESEDLYRIITINETSDNEYNITAMRYSNEKFDYVDEDKYIEKNQNTKKQIVFSTDDYIKSALSDFLISEGDNIILRNLSYAEVVSKDFDYSFYIENEIFTSNFNQKKYEAAEINFIKYFSYLTLNPYVYGLYCTIIKDGKILKFKVNKNEAAKITVFLGEKRESLASQTALSFDIDVYAFDSNMKLINV
jgi:hypothetical protein